MQIGRRFRGSPLWEPVVREDSRIIGETHSQVVRFNYGGIYYTAKFMRFFNRSGEPGKRVSYELSIMRDATRRESAAFAKAMMEQTKWLSTFKRNVKEWADKNC